MKIAFYLLLIALPFGTRVFVHGFIPGFHEYEAAFVSISDVFLIAFALLLIMRGRAAFSFKNIMKDSASRWLLLFVCAAFLSIAFAPSAPLALYVFVRLLLLIGAMYGTASLVRERRVFEVALVIFILLAVLQSIIALFQFRAQGNLGLGGLGESPIAANDPGTSKIMVGSARLVRAYGTFPHPNVLGGFLLIGLLASFHFYLHTMRVRDMSGTAESFLGANLYRRIGISIAIFIIALGLTLTFSRAAWLTGFLASLPFVLYGFGESEGRWAGTAAFLHTKMTSLRFLTLLLMVNYLLFAILGWAVFPRTQFSPGEAAVVDRVSYNKIGMDILTRYPLGVGIGNQVLWSVRNNEYHRFGMEESFLWQPIHNLYLLVGSETGMLGLFGFLAFLFILFFRGIRRGWALENVTMCVMFAALLILGFFDHFLWTVGQGRLLLWIVAGMMLGFASAKGKPAQDSA